MDLLHELGHGLVARRRLGGDVRVVVGTSGRLADLCLFGFRVCMTPCGRSRPGRLRLGLNLVPMTVREGRDGPMLRTDGRIVLDCPRAPRTTTPRPAAAPRARATTTATPSIVSTAGHLPLRGRGGAPLGVPPIARTSFPNTRDDGLARRARRLSANRGRSIPPPER